MGDMLTADQERAWGMVKEAVRRTRELDAMATAYRELKARDPGLILLFAGEGRTLTAFLADAEVLGRIVPGALPYFNTGGTEDDDGISFRAEDREPLLSLILAGGLRAAVLERVGGAAPEGAEVERIVTPGE